MSISAGGFKRETDSTRKEDWLLGSLCELSLIQCRGIIAHFVARFPKFLPINHYLSFKLRCFNHYLCLHSSPVIFFGIYKYFKIYCDFHKTYSYFKDFLINTFVTSIMRNLTIWIKSSSIILWILVSPNLLYIFLSTMKICFGRFTWHSCPHSHLFYMYVRFIGSVLPLNYNL